MHAAAAPTPALAVALLQVTAAQMLMVPDSVPTQFPVAAPGHTPRQAQPHPTAPAAAGGAGQSQQQDAAAAAAAAEAQVRRLGQSYQQAANPKGQLLLLLEVASMRTQA